VHWLRKKASSIWGELKEKRRRQQGVGGGLNFSRTKEIETTKKGRSIDLMSRKKKFRGGGGLQTIVEARRSCLVMFKHSLKKLSRVSKKAPRISKREVNVALLRLEKKEPPQRGQRGKGEVPSFVGFDPRIKNLF